MFENSTAVHISIITSIGAFLTSCISIICGFILIYVGAGSGGTELSIKAGDVTVNFYSLVPGVTLAFFGAVLAAWTVHRLIAK